MRPVVNEVAAREVGQWFSTDPELVMPARPRLISELVVLPLGSDGLLFVGAAEPQVLRGRSARGPLLRLLPLLDGQHTLTEISAQQPELDLRSVRDAVSLLFSRGLLEDGAPGRPIDEATRDTASFIGRHIDASRSHPNRAAAMESLAGSTVEVIGPCRLTEPIAADLRACGVGEVRMAGPTGSAATLTIVVSTGSTADLAARHQSGPAAHTLLVRLGSREAHLGPHLIEGVTACPACVATAHPHPVGEPSEPATYLWLSQAAHLAFLLLTRLPPGPALRGFRRQTLIGGELTEETRLAVRLPGCAACAMPDLDWAPSDPRMLSWIYHSATSIPSRELLSPKDHQGHYVQAFARLASEAPPPVLGARRTVLASVGEDRGGLAAPPPGRRVDADNLAALLARMAGELAEGRQRRRLVPTGGNLGSVACWVVARRVAGLTPGAYRYDAAHHAVDYLGPVDDRELRAALATDESLPASLVLGTGALGKCAAKYQAFAYRLIHLDAGVALAYLHLSAEAMGLRLREYADFTPALPKVFGIPDRWESPLAIVAVGIVDDTADADLDQERTPAQDTSTHQPADEPLGPRDYSFDILPRLIRSASTPPPTTMPRSAARPAPPASPYASLKDLDPLILGRRARRSFADSAVPRHLLEQLMATAHLASLRRLSAGAPECFVIPVLAVALGSDDLPTGLYRAAPGGGRLERRGPFDRAVSEQCSNQRALAAAPVTIFAIGDLGMSVTTRGARGYAELAVHAGSLVGETWLAATRLGLVGTAAGGVIAGGLRAAAGMDGFTECPTLALHLGYPAGETR